MEGLVKTCGACDQAALGRIEGKLDMVIEAQKSQGLRLESLDGRLRFLENRSAIVGAAGALVVTLALELTRWTLRK